MQLYKKSPQSNEPSLHYSILKLHLISFQIKVIFLIQITGIEKSLSRVKNSTKKITPPYFKEGLFLFHHRRQQIKSHAHSPWSRTANLYNFPPWLHPDI